MPKGYSFNHNEATAACPVMVTGTAFGGVARITLQVEFEKEEFVLYNISSQQALNSACMEHVELGKRRARLRKKAA